MHNLISHNNLKAWNLQKEDPNKEKITEYFECVAECNADKTNPYECRVFLE